LYGRNPEHVKVYPGFLVFIGDTLQEAKDKKRQLDSMVDPSTSIATLSVQLGCDASQFDLDGPLPDIPPSNARQTARQKLIDMAREENMSVRELAQYVGG
jgi:alkanesulfonate monooxygenase SsuD/methylene tetrahydromethanopterin reductase-like flavin-dependent oxidoreductase (luciferase family)